jgi:hypothetical protein
MIVVGLRKGDTLGTEIPAMRADFDAMNATVDKNWTVLTERID